MKWGWAAFDAARGGPARLPETATVRRFTSSRPRKSAPALPPRPVSRARAPSSRRRGDSRQRLPFAGGELEPGAGFYVVPLHDPAPRNTIGRGSLGPSHRPALRPFHTTQMPPRSGACPLNPCSRMAPRAFSATGFRGSRLCDTISPLRPDSASRRRAIIIQLRESEVGAFRVLSAAARYHFSASVKFFARRVH